MLIFKMFAELHLPELHNEEEFDRELFEPTHDSWDGDEDAIDAGHGLQNENLYSSTSAALRETVPLTSALSIGI